MKINDEYELGIIVQTKYSNVIKKPNTSLDYKRYKLDLNTEIIKGKLIEIKRRNWLGFKLKQPILCIFIKGNRFNHYFETTEIEIQESL